MPLPKNSGPVRAGSSGTDQRGITFSIPGRTLTTGQTAGVTIGITGLPAHAGLIVTPRASFQGFSIPYARCAADDVLELTLAAVGAGGTIDASLWMLSVLSVTPPGSVE